MTLNSGSCFPVVLFDLGNTLLYFSGDWTEALSVSARLPAAYLIEQGYALDADVFSRDFSRRMDEYYRERDMEYVEYTTAAVLRALLADRGYPDIAEAHVRGALRAMYSYTEAFWKPEDDLMPTLQQLQRAGRRMGILSNASDDTDVQMLIDMAGIRPYFEVILTSAVAGIRKPNPRVFQTALSRFGVGADQAVMVGDTLGADILGARNAGMRSVWITRRAAQADNQAHRESVRPTGTIATLAELPALLDAWEARVG